MKKYILGLVFLCGSLLLVEAQSIKLYGLYRGGTGPWDASYIPLATMDPVTGVPVAVDTITGIGAVVMGSSTFDQTNEEYIFSGPSSPGNIMSLVRANVFTGQVITAPGINATVNEYQYDMQQQKLFGLGGYIVDTTAIPPDYRTRLVTLNPATGSVIEIAKLPEISAVVLGNSTYNSDSAHFIVEGIDTLFQSRMYVIDALTGAIISNNPLNMAQGTYFNEWELDQTTNKMYGLYRDNNQNYMGFAEYDLALNTYTIIDTIPGIIGLSPGASVYDQATGSFIFYGVTNVPQQNRLVTIDASTGQVLHNPIVNGYFIEMEVNNRAYASDRYGNSVSLNEVEENTLSIYPNPFSNNVTLESLGGDIQISNAIGQLVWRGSVPAGKAELNLNRLPAGWYILQSSEGLFEPIRLLKN